MKIVAKGFAYDKSPAAVVGVCRCKNGDLLLAYNTSTDLDAGERIALVRSADRGKTWGKPEAFAESVFNKGGVEAGSSLTRLANGRLLLPYTDGFYLRPGKNADRRTLLFCPTSDDNGKTWQNTKAICFEGLETFPFGKVVELPGGVLLLPLWGAYEKHGEIASGVLKSKDRGNTWAGWRPIVRRNGSETPIVLLPDHRLVALLRQYTEDKDRPFHVSYSSDDGDTWTKPVKVNLHGEAPALHRTPKGRLLAGYRTLQSRCQISSSSDGGLTWKFELELEGPDGRRVGEYPSFENLPDGRILVAYDNGRPIWNVVYSILEEE
ncbi:MAG: exo-alpha-sialidase [Planctomycetes bacterium]|nr:exo-alpha-sialidase [Planctomycetota bacterium]